MTARRVDTLPLERGWSYEFKLDGYRALWRKCGNRMQLRSRQDKDLSAAFPSMLATARLSCSSVLLDGEIVSVGPDGLPSFQALQHPRAHPKHRAVYYAFDLLYLDGMDWMGHTLQKRRDALKRLLRGTGMLYSASLPGSATEVMHWAEALQLEGVVAKRQDSIYDARLRSAWQKWIHQTQQEFVVGGYDSEGVNVTTLIVGYYQGPTLKFAGRVRAGLTLQDKQALYATLHSLAARRCPFVGLPNSRSRWGEGVTAQDMLKLRWVRPEVVVQIRFREWTYEERLRHAQFVGVRVDKRARDVRREG